MHVVLHLLQMPASIICYMAVEVFHLLLNLIILKVLCVCVCVCVCVCE